MPAKSIPKSKHVKFREGSTDVLVIAPHCVNVPDIRFNDTRADLVAASIAKELGCSALINDSFERNERNYNDRHDAELDQEFMDNFRSVLDTAGHTLILWIHGYKERKRLDLEKELRVKGSLDCIVGYGQGNPNRPTATKKTREKLISVLADQGVEAYYADPNGKSSEFCGHDRNNMNQWCRWHPIYKSKSKVESLQLEFKEPGFRKTDEQAKRLGIRVANAIKAMVRPTVERNADAQDANKMNGESVDSLLPPEAASPVTGVTNLLPVDKRKSSGHCTSGKTM
jgi:hypothetical protein